MHCCTAYQHSTECSGRKSSLNQPLHCLFRNIQIASQKPDCSRVVLLTQNLASQPGKVRNKHVPVHHVQGHVFKAAPPLPAKWLEQQHRASQSKTDVLKEEVCVWSYGLTPWGRRDLRRNCRRTSSTVRVYSCVSQYTEERKLSVSRSSLSLSLSSVSFYLSPYLPASKMQTRR